MRAAVVALVMLVSFAARADNVDVLIKQLDDSSDKVRLAAALNLARNTDAKAIPALSKALNNDDESDVRRAAAVALGKIVVANPTAKYKSLAVATLKNASNNDSSSAVKQQAQAALAQIGGGTGGGSTTSGGNTQTPTGGGSNGIYVNVGPMSSKTGTNDKANQGLMVSTTNKTLSRSASHMTMSWPGGTPSGAQLTQKGVSGFYVDGTLNALTTSTSGGTATISCKISMLLADFPNKSVFGFLSGGAQVQASTSPKEITLAQQDCIAAVVEDLIAKKIVPTICTKTQATCP
jgi:hypothetical protein